MTPARLLPRPVTLATCVVLATFVLLASGCALPHIVIHDDPLTPAEHLKLGMAYEANRETDRATTEYTLAARKEPLARLYLGNLLYGQGKLDDAEAEYRKAMQALPNNPEVLNNLAWLLHERRKDLAEAEALALKAVQAAPARPEFQDTLKAIRAAKTR